MPPRIAPRPSRLDQTGRGIELERRLTDDRLRQLFDANVVGILISNNAGAILEANDAFLGIIGYTREDLEGGRLDWRRLTPEEWLSLDEDAIAQMAEHGAFAQYEKEYLRKDGSRVPVSLGGARLTHTADEQICYIVDLTEIRRAESALRRSESRYRRLTDANAIGIISSRPSDHAILEANDEFLRIVGLSRGEFAAGTIRWTELTPPEWQSAGKSAMRDLFRTGRFGPLEKEYFRSDGTRVPVLVGGALLDGSEDEMICYVADLTEQRAATEQIAQNERRYRLLAEALPQLVMLTNAQRRFVYVNHHYSQYTGLSIDEVNDRWRETIHPDDLPAIDRARGAGTDYEIEYRIRRQADGVYRWHFARCLQLPGDSPEERWLSTGTDIDDRKRAEDTLRFIEKAGTLLAQSLDLQTTFGTLLDLIVPQFGDWAAISLLDDRGRIQTIAAAHRDPAKAELIGRLRGAYYVDAASTFGTAAVFRTGKPELLANITGEDVRAATDPAFVDVVEGLGYGSFIALPIFAGTDVIGSFGIATAGDRRRYRASDLPPLEELARRAGFAIGNAREYEREHRVASLLQEAALPRQLPTVRGFTFDGYYRAGRGEARIGGDWYDALVVADGRIVISVGDVAGSGLHAAVLMSNVRQVIRGAAHVYADPMMMFEIADRTLRSEDALCFVTAFVGVIDPVRRTMLYASAGHVPALLRTADGHVRELAAPGLPLGCRDLGSSESRTVMLSPGACLLLYTDGLVEWSRDLIAGEALLRESFARGASDEPNPARTLVERVLPPSGARDDVAALTVTVHSQ
jgi:PAS domain S-box-containing protein